MTFGVPFARGAMRNLVGLQLRAPGGATSPAQVCPLDYWPDGSIRWLLIDAQVTSDEAPQADGEWMIEPSAADFLDDTAIVVDGDAEAVRVSTAGLELGFVRGGAFPISSASTGGRPVMSGGQPGLEITIEGRRIRWVVADVTVVRPGPLRAELLVRARPESDARGYPLEASARIEVFAGSTAVRVQITLTNTRAAQHPGGQWALGDPGSVLMQSALIAFTLPAPVSTVTCATEPGADAESFSPPFAVLQASSGGVHWNARTHVNRDGRVTLPFRGYRLTSPAGEREGLRATPVVSVSAATDRVSATLPYFWQEFPHSIEITGDRLTLGLFPEQSGDLHELQGGERKTQVFAVAFGNDPVSSSPLDWCLDPIRLTPAPEHVSATGVVPCLIPASDDPDAAYLALVATALDETRGFGAKREEADEYGWRHFGDLPADHESAFQPADQPFISHYNNQYDAVGGFAIHYLRTGDIRWWHLMDALARHVRDIDIYHTTEDKAAYSGGLFWHTNHYVDAGTSTHRTYPRGGKSGGGPSAEHNYNYGLMLHYFLTGESASKDAAVGLGQWVLDMDDGSRTPFRWLSSGATGLASASGPGAYQGPGRGAGHSMLACLVAFRLTGDRSYLEKVEELIRRCVHPDRPVSMIYVEDIEGYWSYTAFLQVVGLYLHDKAEHDDYDDAFAYAREALLAHARWMAEHERPYLDRRELLEYPTETWVAQDLRKADTFMWASLHAEGAERTHFAERAHTYFSYVLAQLPSMDGFWYTRPLVLVLSHGYRIGWFKRLGDAGLPLAPRPDAMTFPRAGIFRPQRAVAMRRAMALAAAGGTASLTALLVWLLS